MSLGFRVNACNGSRFVESVAFADVEMAHLFQLREAGGHGARITRMGNCASCHNPLSPASRTLPRKGNYHLDIVGTNSWGVLVFFLITFYNPRMKTDQPKTKRPRIELRPDGWERFEAAVRAAAKNGPLHRPANSTPTSTPSKSTRKTRPR